MVYDSWKTLSPEHIPATTRLSGQFYENLKLGSMVLDLGCGYGRLSNLLSSAGYMMYGVDINHTAVNQAKTNSPSSRFSTHDATRLGFAGATFDGAILQAMLGCMDLSSRRNVLSEVHRVLKLGGVVHIAEFGYNDDTNYEDHALVTGEYGTITVRNGDGTEWFRTHNFSKSELEQLLLTNSLSVVHYEFPYFKTIRRGSLHPGHIFICHAS